MNSAIALDSASIALGGRFILKDVSIAIADGEFIGVLGPNGSGKTTLMRALLGLTPVASGVIRVLGAEVRRGNPLVGYMPQSRTGAAGMRLSGWDFVASAAGGHRFGLPWPSTSERRDVEWALDIVGASELARRPLGAISGGERQRLLLAQTLLGRPRLLLLDEPLINLDPRHQEGIVELVRRINRELGVAVLFSAHEINPLIGALDRVLYLGGQHAALGTVDEVITGPVLSRLYGSEIEVVKLKGRIFVMSGGHDVEHSAHVHDGHHHDHAHGHDPAAKAESDVRL
jgi:zinc/manganese transport system ATP-binding protein